MIVLKVLKIRIYPEDKKVLNSKRFGSNRFVWAQQKLRYKLAWKSFDLIELI